MDKLEQAIKDVELGLKIAKGTDCGLFKTSVKSAEQILELLKEQNRSKHGHWKVLQNCSNSGVYCSECNTKMFDRYPMKKKFSQYCGHCGAHNDLQVEVR